MGTTTFLQLTLLHVYFWEFLYQYSTQTDLISFRKCKLLLVEPIFNAEKHVLFFVLDTEMNTTFCKSPVKLFTIE